MLGNFSFGDYFKERAIPFAWELLTSAESDGRVRLPGEPAVGHRLHRRRRGGQDLARHVGVPEDRIQRRGLADNYWHMGVPGPGGPCSEIYYDRGPEYGREGGPVVDEDRYLEVWNLVFMQEQLGAVRSKTDFDVAGELPVAQHRHRHGPGADGRPAAGRRQHLRDRHHVEGARPRRRADRAAVRPRPPHRRGAAGGDRPRADGGDAGRRRRRAVQRGPRLRAAPDPAPQRPQPAAAVRGAARRLGRQPQPRRRRRALPARAGRRSRSARSATSTRSCSATRRTSTP